MKPPQVFNPTVKVFYSYLLLVLLQTSVHLQSPVVKALASSETDRLSLLAFKATITHDPHGFLRSWNVTVPFCQWPGITCGGQNKGRVTSLVLESKGLEGPLSPSIGNLTSLAVLSLPNNTLDGAMPPQLGQLRSLHLLNLSSNSLDGAIPASLGLCKDLVRIDFANNRLSGSIPFEMGKLLNLSHLDLSNNGLTGEVPPSFGKLLSLATLVLPNNNLTGVIPASLGNLASLSYLDLSGNGLSGLVPSSLTNLSSLSVLELARNHLDGHLPEDLGRLMKLAFFDVSDNNLSGAIPLSLYNIPSLQTLSCIYNHLSGTLPPEIGDTLPNLQFLNMVGNQLEGPIPISLANASGLQQIDLSYNQFSGRIPANLGKLQSLFWLGLESNELEAREASDWDFLSSLTNCTQLEMLNLDKNSLAGELPTSIANLSTRIQRLTFGQNQLTGALPPGIGNLLNLNTLGLQQNNFTGSIPDSFSKLTNLEALVLFSNKLSGKIPSSLGNLTQLNELYLDKNRLQGEIPISLGNCQSLNILDLSGNNLIGSIPKEILSLPSLSNFFRLSSNSLSGPLPSEVGRLKNLGFLDISNNRFSGRMPDTIGECQLLESLYLSGNFFGGVIPSSFKNLRGMKILDLSHNNLSGAFPDFLADLPYLQVVNLSFNNLDGEVPDQGVFKNASAISLLGNNHLCGGVMDLRLPRCSVQTSKKHHTLVLRVIVPVICVIFLLVLMFIICLLMRDPKKQNLSAMPSGIFHWRVSYTELMKATDDFSLENLIGRGTYGSVFKGILSDGEIVVAVKIFDLQQRQALKTFMAECEALRNIRHRNLVKILTTCATVDSRGNDFRALVFEFMPNGSLENWLHPEVDAKIYSRSLKLIERVNIAIDVAAALNYLHNECEIPIVHCDLKPSNVLLDQNMTAHVGDFGLSRFLRTRSTKVHRDPSSSVVVKGSIGYVPPEYGMGSHVSTHGDVYSYGILLLELLTGRRPTDNMFQDGLTLQIFVEKEMSKGSLVIQIVDPSLFSQVGEQTTVDLDNGNKLSNRMEHCLNWLLYVGLSCVKESPKERVKMKDVESQMMTIRELLLS
ncbi:uncharacterized protein [Typha latifolia]|uniref:uncharacterized protein n=1 Tax=Typha latifolia TaxID=4733 RepID=UPI003C2EF8A3